MTDTSSTDLAGALPDGLYQPTLTADELNTVIAALHSHRENSWGWDEKDKQSVRDLRLRLEDMAGDVLTEGNRWAARRNRRSTMRDEAGMEAIPDPIAKLRSQRDRAEEHLYAARQRIAELEKAIREHQIEVMYEDITIDADRHLWAMLDGREVRLPTRGEGST